MTQKSVFYQPGQPHDLPHDPFNAIIAPRPIGWISTMSAQGVANLAPYSFFNAFNYHPPIIGFSSIGYKDTVKNIKETGEFCWNFVSEGLAEAMNQTSASLDAEVDEFQWAGIDKRPSKLIQVPQVAASPVVMECRLSQIVQLQSVDGQLCDSYLVLGEVVGVHIAAEFLDDGVFNTAKAQPILRAGGPADYFTITQDNKRQLYRPKVK